MASRSWEFHASTQCCANCRASVSVSIRWIKRIVDVDLKWAALLRAAQPCCLRAATNAFNARVTIAPMVRATASRVISQQSHHAKNKVGHQENWGQNARGVEDQTIGRNETGVSIA
jgi:hypothetical protein